MDGPPEAGPPGQESRAPEAALSPADDPEPESTGQGVGRGTPPLMQPGATLDAGVAAARDAGLLLLPRLENRSFELTQGQPGDLTTISLPTFTAIAPWYTCQPIGQGSQGPLSAARAERAIIAPPGSEGESAVIDPSGGETFVSMRYLVNLIQVPLIQQLGEPLRAGQRYGFAIDVRATGAAPHLSLQVMGGRDCLGILSAPEVLATSSPVRTDGWQTLCVSFTPRADHPVLGLRVISNPPLSDDMLLFDALRETAECVPAP